jgi:hypothetical protein
LVTKTHLVCFQFLLVTAKTVLLLGSQHTSGGSCARICTTDISVKAEIMDGLTIQAGWAEDGATNTSTTGDEDTQLL